MTPEEILVEIEQVLVHLEQISFVAHRDAKEALESLESIDPADRLYWLETARDLFFHDREAGKAFMRGTPALAAAMPALRPWVDQARAFSQWVNSWRALAGFMAQAGEVSRAWGESGEQRWYEIGLRWLKRSVEDARAYFEVAYTDLGGEDGLEGLERLIEPAERLFDERGLPLDVYLEGALIARNLVGYDGIESWARRGADILQAGRARGEAFFKLESEESLRLLLDGLQGYRPRGHTRLLQLLLLAWYNEHIPMADSAWRPGRGRPMVDTDGRQLYLPAVLGDREETIVAVLHAAGHLRFDTYCREDIEALFARVGMAHPPLDADQRITWRPLYAHFEERMFRFQVLFDLCEDLRVDARIGALIPGYLTRALRLARHAPVPEGAAGTYFRFALAALQALVEGEGLDARLQPLLSEAARVSDAFDVANRLFEDDAFPPLDIAQREACYLPGHGFNTSLPVYPRARHGEARYSQDADAHAENRAEKEKQQQEQPLSAPEMQQNDPDPDINVPQENTSGSGGRIGVGIPMPARTVSQRGARREERTDGIPYPEWDYREQRYIADWARVQERRLEDMEPARAESLLAQHAGALKRLRRALEMQRPSRMAPLRRQIEGDELDMEATISYVAEKRAGLSPKPYIYRRRQVEHRDTGVLLLADLSTSIMARHPKGQGKIIDRLRAGMLMFAEAINDVGDEHAICGFASKHHDNVNYYVLKDFDENLTADVRARIAAASGRLASRMGAAIRHSLHRLGSVSAQHRLLLILSDGRPADYDDGGDSRYLHEDTRMAMKEAIDAGVHPFCITLDPSGSEYLPAIFGHGHYTILDNVDELPARLPEIYLRLRR
ncbi:MAG: VWA domain-containing protein [Gammaproteobacteria bacterium]|jgi:nitric oxide reductase NorD protein